MSFKNSSRPSVTVVLTSFNCKQYLPMQIDSILNQTYQNWNLIIADDGSTDGTREIAERYSKTHPGIEVITHRNVGVSKNFESGLVLANGEYIAGADGDDYWLPDKLEKGVTYLEDNQHIGMVYHDSKIVDSELNIINSSFMELQGVLPYSPQIETLDNLLQRNHATGHTIMFRNSLSKYLVPVPSGFLPDHWIALIAAEYSKIGYISEPLVLYRQREGSIHGAAPRGIGFLFRALFRKGHRVRLLNDLKALHNGFEELQTRLRNERSKNVILETRLPCYGAFIDILAADTLKEYFDAISKSVQALILAKDMKMVAYFGYVAMNILIP